MKIKKLLCLVMALCLVFALSVMSFAVEHTNHSISELNYDLSSLNVYVFDESASFMLTYDSSDEYYFLDPDFSHYSVYVFGNVGADVFGYCPVIDGKVYLLGYSDSDNFVNIDSLGAMVSPVSYYSLLPEPEPELEPVSVSTITGAMTDVFSLSGTIINEITSQPVLLMLFAAGLIPLGISTFKKLFGAAKRRV